MIRFGEIKNLATGEIREIDGAVRLEGEGWYIEVCPEGNRRGLYIRCSGSVLGESKMIVRPSVGNAISVSSEASERVK